MTSGYLSEEAVEVVTQTIMRTVLFPTCTHFMEVRNLIRSHLSRLPEEKPKASGFSNSINLGPEIPFTFTSAEPSFEPKTVSGENTAPQASVGGGEEDKALYRAKRREEGRIAFRDIPTEELKRRHGPRSSVTPEMIELLRREGKQMVLGKVIDLPENERCAACKAKDEEIAALEPASQRIAELFQDLIKCATRVRAWQMAARQMDDVLLHAMDAKSGPNEIGDARAAYAALLKQEKPRVGQRDVTGEYSWREEDSHLENGNYECECCHCGVLFWGHKRRVSCKICALAPKPVRTQTECPGALRMVSKDEAGRLGEESALRLKAGLVANSAVESPREARMREALGKVKAFLQFSQAFRTIEDIKRADELAFEIQAALAAFNELKERGELTKGQIS